MAVINWAPSPPISIGERFKILWLRNIEPLWWFSLLLREGYKISRPWYIEPLSYFLRDVAIGWEVQTIGVTSRRSIRPRQSKVATYYKKTAVNQHKDKKSVRSRRVWVESQKFKMKRTEECLALQKLLYPSYKTSSNDFCDIQRSLKYEKRPQKRKRLSSVEKTLPKQIRVAKHLETYKEYFMDVINKCNSLNFCPARTMPAMSLVLKHCHPMSFYLGRQRDNDGKFNLCM